MAVNKPMQARYFQQRVLRWFDQHGRHDLPWQQNVNAYRVWLSEIMLQQTQVATVIPYYQRFLQAFPDVKALAKADRDEVLHLWSGLGYYARARNLHKAAITVVENFNGKFPCTVDELVELPGIGRSTAGAVSAIAYGQHSSILDGNVKRVLARFAAVEGWPGKPAIADQLWLLADNYTPAKRVADYTQAMMDLGATVCVRSKPRCEQCPLNSHCQAYKQNRISELPGKKPKKALPIKQTQMLVISHRGGEILLQKRPSTGIWGGLWSLPELTANQDISSFLFGLYASNTIKWQLQSTQPEFRHTFSHYHLDITPVHLLLDPLPNTLMEANQWQWCAPNALPKIGLPAPVSKILSTGVLSEAELPA